MNAIFIWTRRLCCSLLLKQWISSKKKQKTGSLVFTNKRLLQIHPNFKEISQSLIYLKTLCSSRSTSTTVQDKQDFDFCQTWLLEFRPGSLCEVVLGHSVIKAWVTGCFLSGSFSHSSYRGLLTEALLTRSLSQTGRAVSLNVNLFTITDSARVNIRSS